MCQSVHNPLVVGFGWPGLGVTPKAAFLVVHFAAHKLSILLVKKLFFDKIFQRFIACLNGVFTRKQLINLFAARARVTRFGGDSEQILVTHTTTTGQYSSHKTIDSNAVGVLSL